MVCGLLAGGKGGKSGWADFFSTGALGPSAGDGLAGVGAMKGFLVVLKEGLALIGGEASSVNTIQKKKIN